MLVGAAAGAAEALCENAAVKFPQMTAEERAHLKLTATATCIVAAEMVLLARELPSEERVDLSMIVFDNLRAGDPALRAAVDECEEYVDDLVMPSWDSGKPVFDPLERLELALAHWMGENAFGLGLVHPRMVQFAKNAGAAMRWPMDSYWDDAPLRDPESRA